VYFVQVLVDDDLSEVCVLGCLGQEVLSRFGSIAVSWLAIIRAAHESICLWGEDSEVSTVIPNMPGSVVVIR
jgi:hypothetical protein